jgi:cyclase
MLRPRIIPVLLVHNSGLTKTVKFKPGKYVGDPLNAVRIFNEKEVDEIAVLDIDATVHNREPDYILIGNLAAECRMPLCYGGGVKTAEQVQRIVALGVEKVAISSAAIEDWRLVSESAGQVGSQSVVVVMDVKRRGLVSHHHEVFTHNGTRATGLSPVDVARRSQEMGAGEIVVNSMDRDGEMKGYDLELARQVRAATSLPMTVVGGAGSLDDLATLIREFGLVGAAAGSLFVFRGKYRAVLINYPDAGEKNRLRMVRHR